MQRITSRQNAVVARYRDAARSGTTGEVLLDGTHLVAEAVDAGMTLHHVLVASSARERPEIAALVQRLLRTPSVAAAEGSDGVMEAVSPVRSSSPIVALAARPDTDRVLFSGPSPVVAILAGIQDPGNVGAIVRVAEAAGASGVLLAGDCADPFGWKALRASMGSALRLPLVSAGSVDEAVAGARRCGARVVATVPRGGVPLFEAPLDGPLALLVGGEGPGLPPGVVDTADLSVSIPMQGPVESLNAAVAAALLLYEVMRQRQAWRLPLAAQGLRQG